MAYQPKHSDSDEQSPGGAGEYFDLKFGDPIKTLVGLLSKIGRQEEVNMIFLAMIEDLYKVAVALLGGKPEDEDEEPDPLETALAHGQDEPLAQ